MDRGWGDSYPLPEGRANGRLPSSAAPWRRLRFRLSLVRAEHREYRRAPPRLRSRLAGVWGERQTKDEIQHRLLRGFSGSTYGRPGFGEGKPRWDLHGRSDLARLRSSIAPQGRKPRPRG